MIAVSRDAMNGAAFYREKAERYRLWASKARTPDAALELEEHARRFEEMAAQAAAGDPVPAAPTTH
jgi:hypothetical protein